MDLPTPARDRARTRMRILVPFLLIVVAVATYVPLRTLLFQSSFDRLNIGSPQASVQSVMGSGFVEARGESRYLTTPVEYQYFFWPNPKRWVVGFRDGVVADKQIIEAP